MNFPSGHKIESLEKVKKSGHFVKKWPLYLDGAYGDCDIWIRNVYIPPSLSDGRDWTFWQYTNKGYLKGYQGKEKYIDINVFHGTEEEFRNYP